MTRILRHEVHSVATRSSSGEEGTSLIRSKLTEDEAIRYWREVLRVGRVMAAYFGAVKLNIEMLGNWVPHLHTHITSRYADDDIAPNEPISWLERDREVPSGELERDARSLSRLLDAYT